MSAVILEDPPWREKDPEFTPEQFAARSKQNILARKKLSQEEIIRLGKEENPGWADAEFEDWSEAKLQVYENISSAITAKGFNWHDAADFIHCPALLLIADPELGP